MKSFIVLSVLLAVALAAPAIQPVSDVKPPVEILHSEFQKEADGSYHYSYENSDGSARDERGIVIHRGEENEAVAVEGTYRFIDGEGKPVEVHYKADDNGYVPEGGDVDPTITYNARAASEAHALEAKQAKF